MQRYGVPPFTGSPLLTLLLLCSVATLALGAQQWGRTGRAEQEQRRRRSAARRRCRPCRARA